MPTENRSSNTEMVSVKRELVEQAMQACFEAGFGIPHDALRDVLAKPAQQHQGDPVALPMRRSWAGIAGWKDRAEIKAWNACLDEIAKLGPLYTHPAPADNAEVERLRAENQSLRRTLPNSTTELVDLRAKLAEAQALLDECVTEMQLAITDPSIRSAMTSIGRQRFLQIVQSHNLRREAALSASVEPEAKS